MKTGRLIRSTLALPLLVGGPFITGCDTDHCEAVQRVALDPDEEYEGGPSPADLLAEVVGDYTEPLRWNRVHAQMPAENSEVYVTIRAIEGGGAWYIEEESDDFTCPQPRIQVDVSIGLDSADGGLSEWFIGTVTQDAGDEDDTPLVTFALEAEDISGTVARRMTSNIYNLLLLMSVNDQGNLVGALEGSRKFDGAVGVGVELVPLAIWGPDVEDDGRFDAQ